MTRGMRGPLGLVLTTIVLTMLALSGSAAAHDAAAPPGCAGGEADGDGRTPLNSFTFTVCRHGSDPHDVSGYFSSVGTPPSDLLVAPRGPVTCAEFHGSTVSFLYPLAPGSRPGVVAGRTSIEIVATDGGPGRPDLVNFLGPLPSALFANRCSPLPGVPGPVIGGGVTVRP